MSIMVVHNIGLGVAQATWLWMAWVFREDVRWEVRMAGVLFLLGFALMTQSDEPQTK